MGFLFYDPGRPIEDGEAPSGESRVLFYIVVGGALLASTIGLIAVMVR